MSVITARMRIPVLGRKHSNNNHSSSSSSSSNSNSMRGLLSKVPACLS